MTVLVPNDNVEHKLGGLRGPARSLPGQSIDARAAVARAAAMLGRMRRYLQARTPQQGHRLLEREGRRRHDLDLCEYGGLVRSQTRLVTVVDLAPPFGSVG